MSAATLVDLRAAMVHTIAETFPALRTVEAHRGRFDSEAEIKRYAVRGPAVLVACGGFDFPATDATGLYRMPASWNAFVLTRDTSEQTRDVAALAISQALATLIGDADWGRDDVAAARGIQARNLYAQSIDQLGVGLWALAWTQDFFATALDAATLHDFLVFHQNTDAAPADGAIDISQTTDIPQ